MLDEEDGQGGAYEDCEMIADLESPFLFDDEQDIKPIKLELKKTTST